MLHPQIDIWAVGAAGAGRHPAPALRPAPHAARTARAPAGVARRGAGNAAAGPHLSEEGRSRRFRSRVARDGLAAASERVGARRRRAACVARHGRRAALLAAAILYALDAHGAAYRRQPLSALVVAAAVRRCRVASLALATRALTPIEIVYEDDALLAVNKPAGLLVHRSSDRRGRKRLPARTAARADRRRRCFSRTGSIARRRVSCCWPSRARSPANSASSSWRAAWTSATLPSCAAGPDAEGVIDYALPDVRERSAAQSGGDALARAGDDDGADRTRQISASNAMRWSKRRRRPAAIGRSASTSITCRITSSATPATAAAITTGCGACTSACIACCCTRGGSNLHHPLGGAPTDAAKRRSTRSGNACSRAMGWASALAATGRRRLC